MERPGLECHAAARRPLDAAKRPGAPSCPPRPAPPGAGRTNPGDRHGHHAGTARHRHPRGAEGRPRAGRQAGGLRPRLQGAARSRVHRRSSAARDLQAAQGALRGSRARLLHLRPCLRKAGARRAARPWPDLGDLRPGGRRHRDDRLAHRAEGRRGGAFAGGAREVLRHAAGRRALLRRRRRALAQARRPHQAGAHRRPQPRHHPPLQHQGRRGHGQSRLRRASTGPAGEQENAMDNANALPPPGEVIVEDSGTGAFSETVRSGRHVLAADEPAANGGDDTGPDPYGYLLAALGACTAMTLRMYARQKKWPLQKVRVRLRHDKIHAADCATCETKDGKVDRIERSLELDGPLDDSQRQRLLEIADRCPVHRTLKSEILISTRLDAAR
ncbi:MAG: OsmC family protein [Reyranella sp.]|nr:OsmC family protein [Reyranella sp.]